jgi:hypothetical protein
MMEENISQESLNKRIRVKKARGGVATVGEVLAELRRPKAHRGVVSGDFLSVSDVDGGWECECGFRNAFKSVERCSRCGR